MIRKETRIINGREAHLYYDEERQTYLVASDLMEVFLGLYENADKLVNQLAEETIHESSSKSENVLETSSGWIPCSDKKPMYFEDVFVCTKTGGITIACMPKINGGDRWVDRYSNMIGNVIAWQPLPAPYQKEGGRDVG